MKVLLTCLTIKQKMQNWQLKLLVVKDHDLTFHQNDVGYYKKSKNITFEIEERSEVFKELKETLYSTLERLYWVTKKEQGLTLNIKDAKVNSKFNLINIIPVRKIKRNVSRVGEKPEKLKAAANIVIKDIKKLFPANVVEEELILQDYFYFEALQTLTKSREKIINVSSDSEGVTDSEFSKSLANKLSKEDL